MNRKVKSFTILITGLLVASICFSALSQGALLSDQLIVTEGSYVKGKYLYTNSTHNDVLMAYMTLSVDEIWNDTNTLLNLVNFKVLYEFQADGENPLGADDMTIMEITAAVFEHNRTTFLPAATLMMRNATWEASVDILYLKDTAGMMDFDKANITIDNKIKEYEKQLEEADNEEEKKEIDDKKSYQEQKKRNYQKLEDELQSSGESQISLTDPDAKSVVLHRNIINVGYNVQAASDEKHKLLIHADTGNVNDTHDLAPIATECKELSDKDTITALADKGYNTGEQLQKCKDNDIITYVSPKDTSSPGKDCFSVEIFEYNSENDTYTCPAGETLETDKETALAFLRLGEVKQLFFGMIIR